MAMGRITKRKKKEGRKRKEMCRRSITFPVSGVELRE